MHAKNLLKLAAFVETIAPDEFDMRTFGKMFGERFVGCAMAHAARAEVFQGLKHWEDSRELDVRNGQTQSCDIEYKGFYHFDAVQRLFNLELTPTLKLFMPSDDPSPTEVARRLRAYVKTEQEIVA